MVVKSRICPKCNEEYPLTTEFWHKDKHREDGLTLHCIFCRRNNNKHYRKYGRTKVVKQTEEGRWCPTCELRYPPTLDYWQADSSDLNGLGWECKVCAQNRSIQRNRAKGMEPRESIRKDGKKRCSRCKKWQNADLDHFSYDKNSIDKLNYVCRKCNQGKMKTYWKKNRQKLIEEKRRHYKNNKKSILQKQKLYYEDNKDWIRERDKAYYEKNKKAILAQMKEYRESNSQLMKTRSQRYYQNNRARIIRKNKEYATNNRTKVAQTHRKWYAKNIYKQREYQRIWGQKRRALKQRLPNTLTLEDWEVCLDYFNNQCAVCQSQADMFRRLDADHWIPLSHDDCPGTVAENILPLCSSIQAIDGQLGCNQSKGNKDPEKWLTERFGEVEAKKILKRIKQYFQWLREN